MHVITVYMCSMHDSIIASLYSVLDDVKHIGPIADFMSEWDGAIGDALELTYADRAAISEAHPRKVDLQK